MKPSTFGSPDFSRSTRVLSVLSFAVLFTTTGCYTKLATNEGDHWGYTGPVKQKVVVRETDDTIVVRETRVIHQPQPVVTDTLTYSNTTTGEENVVVNNYFAPPPATFGAYDPWTNTYPTWYDDYWYRPHAAVVISIGDPYYHPRWFNSHWRRHAYYQSYWDYNYYNPWDNWYHVSYRGPGWAYYDPYYPYPPLYGYGYGCNAPYYVPYGYWPYYGYGYGYGGYYDDGYYGHGHHHYYDDNDDRDRDGRERKRGNVGGEGRGRGGVTTDNGGNRTGVIVPRTNGAQANTSTGERINGTQVSTRGPVDAGSETATNGGVETVGSGSAKNASSGSRIGNFDISTGEMPVELGRSANTSSGRAIKSSPSETAPNIYTGSNTSTSTVSNTPAPVERRPAMEPVKPATRATSAPTTVVKDADASGTRSSSSSRPGAPAQAPSYTPRSSNSSGSSSVSSGSSSSGSRASSSSSSGSSSSSRGGDSRSSDSRSNSDGGSRGRR